jgi:hypothetical protein
VSRRLLTLPHYGENPTALLNSGQFESYCLVSNEHLRIRMAGLCYDKHHVWALTVAVTIPHKLLCVLRGGFIRKNFRINPLQGGLVGKFAFYRHLSRKKVRLNRCSAAWNLERETS